MPPASSTMLALPADDDLASWGSAGDPFFASNDSFPEPVTRMRTHSVSFPTSSSLSAHSFNGGMHIPSQQASLPTPSLMSFGHSDRNGSFSSVSTPVAIAGSLPTFGSYTDMAGSAPLSFGSSLSTSAGRAIPISSSPSISSTRGSHPYAANDKRRRRVNSRNGERDDDDTPHSFEDEKRIFSEAKEYMSRRGRRNGMANLLADRLPRSDDTSPLSLPSWSTHPPDDFSLPPSSLPREPGYFGSRSTDDFEQDLRRLHLHYSNSREAEDFEEKFRRCKVAE